MLGTFLENNNYKIDNDTADVLDNKLPVSDLSEAEIMIMSEELNQIIDFVDKTDFGDTELCEVMYTLDILADQIEDEKF